MTYQLALCSSKEKKDQNWMKSISDNWTLSSEKYTFENKNPMVKFACGMKFEWEYSSVYYAILTFAHRELASSAEDEKIIYFDNFLNKKN
jgi:hypothetical protein